MLNFECVDNTEDGNIELCFTDSEGDESIKICVSERTAWEIVRGIQAKISYAAKKERN